MKASRVNRNGKLKDEGLAVVVPKAINGQALR